MKQDVVLKIDGIISGSTLSRSQMKQVLGGTETEGGTCSCRVGIACNLYVANEGKSGGTTYPGECDANWGGGSGTFMPCGCSTSQGPYVPSGGTSHCCA